MSFLTQKLGLEKNKTDLIPDEKIAMPRFTTRITEKKNVVFPTVFG